MSVHALARDAIGRNGMRRRFDTQNIRFDGCLLARQQRSEPTQSRSNFVGDEDQIMPPGRFANSSQ